MTHRQTQHGLAKGGLGLDRHEAEGFEEPRIYRMAFPDRKGHRSCPVKRCSGQASTQRAMRVHLCKWHVRDTMAILEESNLPHPFFLLCDTLVLRKALNGTHRRTAQCTRGAERKRLRLVAEDDREVTARAFSAYGFPLEMVASSKYLVRLVSAADNDWLAVV